MPARRFVVAALLLIPLAVGTVVWSLARGSSKQLRPGKVEVVLVDGLGQPWSEQADVWLGNEWKRAVGGVAGVFDVTTGTVRLVARGVATPGMCGSSMLEARRPFEGGKLEVSVGGWPTDEVQRLEVRLGPSLLDITQIVAADGYERWKAERNVRVQVLQSDGGPAANALVLCRHDTSVTADESGIAKCGPFIGELEISASANGFGNSLWLVGDAGEATLVLDRPGFALDVEVRGLITAGNITLNSKETRDMVFSKTNSFSVPFVPVARTIVCTTSDAPQAACDVVVPDGGAHHALVLEVGAPGTLEFSPTLGGQPLLRPILYIDRVKDEPAAATTQKMMLSRGRHVLIINTSSGPERYETLFEIEPGKTTALGELELAAP